MKKILLGVLAILVLVFVGFFIGSKRGGESEIDKSNSENVVSDTAQNNSAESAGGSKTSSVVKVNSTTPLATNLFPQKGSYKCVYEQATQTGRSNNTVYIADGKMRAEFRSLDSQGFGTLSMMVYDGTYLYRWVEGQSKGTVTRPTSLSQIPVVVPTDIREGKVLGSSINNVSWDCYAWSKVSSMLSKPSYVQF
ncbi:MAG: hypothetical protein WAW92_04630 [Minisyncoccia bacterium]